MEQEPKTAGIAPAPKNTALNVLQFTASENVYRDGYDVVQAAEEVANYHAPSTEQAARHKKLSVALEQFLVSLVENAPAGPERSTAISRAREAKMWASAAIALEGR